MVKKRSELKILLIQIRRDRETLADELDEFSRFGRLDKEQFEVLNLFDTSHPPASAALDYDAVFVGGSSDASVRFPDKYSFVRPCEALLRLCVERDIPVFASCYGFQAVAMALGGKVDKDLERREMGVIDLKLLPEAEEDVLLHDCPSSFQALAGHEESAVYLPEIFIPLGGTERCPYHIFKVRHKPFYAFQFHPELDYPDFLARMGRYAERYGMPEDEQQMIRDSVCDTAVVNGLIGKFIDRIVLECENGECGEEAATETTTGTV